MSISAAKDADGLPPPRRYWSIVTIALGLFMAVMDGAIANVALPTIAGDLHASPSFSIWIVNGYQLAVVVSLLPLASLGEIVGYRRIYLAGLALFTAASLICALSRTLFWLTAARVLQGFGAAGLMSVNAALVRFTYPHRLLGRGIGINAFIVAVAAAIGPTLASAILAVGRWPWLFAINLPLGLAALSIGRKVLPRSPLMTHSFDWPSALLCAIAFGAGIAAIDSAGHLAPPFAYVTEFAAALIAGTTLVRRQLKQPSPLLPVDLLRIPLFALSIVTSVASFCAQMLAYVSLPFFFHGYFGFSAVQIGLFITPWPIAVACVAPIAGLLVERYSAGLLGSIGLLVFAAGLLELALLSAHPSTFDV
ncbi:MAG TPA: MFS transporter, partial [Rhizomicrobium sp.]|nr:MFS transporter [Rhizomicrobium sp.]